MTKEQIAEQAKTPDQRKAEWLALIRQTLEGRRIVAVRLMTDAELRSHCWSRRAVVLQLDNGKCIYPSADDEGNDAGALFTTSAKLPVIPVFA